MADYLPAPHGLPGFAAPVEQTAPAGTSFFEMPDGRTVVTTDGADEIVPGNGGRSLRATWRRFALVGGKTGELIEPGFEVSTTWQIDGATLTRTETLTSGRDLTIRRLSFLLSSTATSHSQPATADGPNGVIHLAGQDGVLDVRTAGDLTLATSIRQVGDEPPGRGPRVPIPTHVTIEATDIPLRAARPMTWVVSLTASAPIGRTR